LAFTKAAVTPAATGYRPLAQQTSSLATKQA